jgi:acyl carrier protein
MADLKNLVELIGALDIVPDMSKFDPNKTFKENGIDSLDVMSVFLAIEERLGLKFSEDEVAKINSAADLINILSARNSAL